MKSLEEIKWENELLFAKHEADRHPNEPMVVYTEAEGREAWCDEIVVAARTAMLPTVKVRVDDGKHAAVVGKWKVVKTFVQEGKLKGIKQNVRPGKAYAILAGGPLFGRNAVIAEFEEAL